MPIQSFLRFFSVWVHRRYDVAVYRRCATSKKSVSRNISVLYFFSWQFTWCTLDVLSSRRLPHCSAIPLQWFHSSASCKRPDEMFKVSHSTSHWRIQGRGPGPGATPYFYPPPPPPPNLSVWIRYCIVLVVNMNKFYHRLFFSMLHDMIICWRRTHPTFSANELWIRLTNRDRVVKCA